MGASLRTQKKEATQGPSKLVCQYSVEKMVPWSTYMYTLKVSLMHKSIENKIRIQVQPQKNQKGSSSIVIRWGMKDNLLEDNHNLVKDKWLGGSPGVVVLVVVVEARGSPRLVVVAVRDNQGGGHSVVEVGGILCADHTLLEVGDKPGAYHTQVEDKWGADHMAVEVDTRLEEGRVDLYETSVGQEALPSLMGLQTFHPFYPFQSCAVSAQSVDHDTKGCANRT